MDINWWGARPLNRHSPIPLHQQLADLLAAAIYDGTLKAGDQLPSENELLRLLNISRSVVRQTLNNLSRQGLIYTEHGRGSFVSAQKIVKPLDILQSYHAGMKKAGIAVDVRILSKSILIPNEEIAHLLALKRDDKVFLLERIAFDHDLPVSLLTSYVALGAGDEDKVMRFGGGSLYEFLARECDIHLASSHNTVEIVFARENDSRLLNCSNGSALMQIQSVSYNQAQAPIERAIVVYPGFMFRFQYDSYRKVGSGETSPLIVR
jgi:DNA-binding GntR family transcriptional regulator